MFTPKKECRGEMARNSGLRTRRSMVRKFSKPEQDYYLILISLILVLCIVMALLSINNKTDGGLTLLVQEQLLIPSKTWNWEEQITGFLPLNMVNFVDTLPFSCRNLGSFNFSSNRLFDNYRLLLDLLDSSFQPQVQLLAAKKLVQKPHSNPVDSVIPPGWAKVKDGAGIVRWTPSYSISAWPKEWLAEVKTMRGNAQTIRIPLASKTPLPLILFDQNNKQKSVPLANQGNYLEIIAQAWNRIKITPGTWFNSGLIKLIKHHQGSFKGGYDFDALFGSQGLINCRISELLVAYQPKVELIANKSFVLNHDKEVMQATQIRFGQIDFSKASKQPINDNESHYLYTLSVDSEEAIIIAVNVAPI